MHTRDKGCTGRRQFLKQTLAVGGTGVLMVLAASEAEGESPQPHTVSNTATEQGYRLTDHIRTYYDTTRS